MMHMARCTPDSRPRVAPLRVRELKRHLRRTTLHEVAYALRTRAQHSAG